MLSLVCIELVCFDKLIYDDNREACFTSGANMVTNESHSMRKLLNVIGQRGYHGTGNFKCPYCNMQHLTEDELYYHIPLYHANQSEPDHVICPVCEKRPRQSQFLWHLRFVVFPFFFVCCVTHKGDSARVTCTHAFLCTRDLKAHC